MKAVVLFVDTGRRGQPEGGWKNKVYARTLRKIGFIDNRYQGGDQGPDQESRRPKNGEHWLVKIVRENQNSKGGCFILQPIHKIPNDDLSPLIHGMYEMKQDEDAVIITPNDMGAAAAGGEPTVFWVMSPAAKKSIQQAFGDNTKALVINHGGGMWQRRKPPEDVIEGEAERLLRDIEGDDT